MKFLPYIVIGVLLVIGIVSVITSEKSDPLENLVAAPTSGPINPPVASPTASSVLGEESVDISSVSTATISTTKGEIEITFFADAAPNTVKNFVEKSLTGYYNNLTFHRVEDWVAQGGDPLGNGTGGGQMPTELNNNPFIRGSVGVARRDNIEISNDSQFFITKSDSPHLDKLYTNFGQVSSGLDVVDSLQIGDKILSIKVE